ncbi:MAG TPA: gamma-glutamyltransferase, partial [Bacteroidales bacterium]|nr:gamma-glutamyltransferase [Bacteroidales bacterium]
MERSIILLALLIFTGACSKQLPVIIEGRGIITGNGMVVSAHQESSRIGAEILRKGGNAVDAGVATEFALAVCYPEAGNIGGGGFWILRTNDGSFTMLDYREKAPLMSGRNMFLDAEGNVIEGMSTATCMASGVPGTVDGMLKIHERSGILPFSEVIQPAIDLARNGFPLTPGGAASLNSHREAFITRNSYRPDFVKEQPWQNGDTHREPRLAVTLERIRDYGREGFYSGETARLIIKEMEKGKGIMNMDDLSGYNAVFREPLSTDYKGYRITTASPPSAGGTLLIQLLRMTESRPLAEMGFHSAGAVHLVAEAQKRAFADRAEHMGDPDYMLIPVALLAKKEYNEMRMSSFSENAATFSRNISPGKPDHYESEETTHYSVVDAMGNAVAATTTLNGSFGSSIIVEGAGFLLNNQMDDFSL